MKGATLAAVGKLGNRVLSCVIVGGAVRGEGDDVGVLVVVRDVGTLREDKGPGREPFAVSLSGEKVELKLEDWGQFPLVTPVVMVTTVDEKGRPNAAIKSWLMTIDGEPPLIMFSCNMKHDTAKNVLETREFVVNIPNNDIAEKALVTAKQFPRGVNEIERAGLTAIPSKRVRPPSIKECIAHAECVLEEVKKFPIGAYGNLFIGRVVYASVSRELLEASEDEKYRFLDQMMAYDVYAELRPDKLRRRTKEQCES